MPGRSQILRAGKNEAIPAGAGQMAWQGLAAVAGVVRHGRRKSLIRFESKLGPRTRSSWFVNRVFSCLGE
jgi:hypothetical protein